MPTPPKVFESSDETTRYPPPYKAQRAHGHILNKARIVQRLPMPGSPITTVDDFRDYYRVVKFPERKGHAKIAPLPDFPRIPDGAASLEWGRAAARDFVASMVSCRMQTQVPACYIAEKMGVAPPIVYRLEGNPRRGIKLDTALRYLYALGLEVEIVEYPEKKP